MGALQQLAGRLGLSTPTKPAASALARGQIGDLIAANDLLIAPAQQQHSYQTAPRHRLNGANQYLLRAYRPLLPSWRRSARHL